MCHEKSMTRRKKKKDGVQKVLTHFKVEKFTMGGDKRDYKQENWGESTSEQSYHGKKESGIEVKRTGKGETGGTCKFRSGKNTWTGANIVDDPPRTGEKIQ